MRKVIFSRKTSVYFVGFILTIIFFETFLFGSGRVLFKFIYSTRYPVYDWLHKQNGILSLWSPYILGGFPIYAEAKYAFFSPFTIVFLKLLDPAVGMMFLIITLYSGIFFSTYLYSKYIGMKNVEALLSSVLFTFNGFVLSLYTAVNDLITVSALPLLALFLERIFPSEKGINYRYVFLSGLILGLQFLGGGLEYFFYILILAFSLFCFKFFQSKKQISKIVLAIIIIVVVSLGISSIQLLPMLELVKSTARVYSDYRVSASISGNYLSGTDFFLFLFPSSINGELAVSHICTALFLGFVPFLLVILSIFKKDKRCRLFIVLLIISAFLMLGRNSLFYYIFSHLRFPGFNMLKHPVEAGLIFTFAASILSGYGLSTLGSMVDDNRWKKSIVVLACFAIFAAGFVFFVNHLPFFYNYNFMVPQERIMGIEIFALIIVLISFLVFISAFMFNTKRRYLDIIVIVLITANLYIFRPMRFLYRGNAGIGRSKVDSIVETVPGSVSFLKKDKSLYRIYSLYRRYKEPYGLLNDRKLSIKKWLFISKLKEIKWAREILIKNIAMDFDLFSFSGYSSLPLSRYLEYTKTSASVNPLKMHPYSDFLGYPDFLKASNIKYIIVSKNVGPACSFCNGNFNKVYEDEFTNVYLYNDYLPRSFFVNKALVIKDKQKILNTLKNPSFNPETTVILEETPPYLGKKTSLKPQYHLKIIEYTPNEVKIFLRNKEPGFLILLDTYYPGWCAYLDNKPVKIYRADYLFRTVYISKEGNHLIIFKYRPKSFFIGAVITILTLISCFVWLWRTRRGQKKILD